MTTANHKLALPQDLKLESQPRIVQKAIFDRIDLVIDFRPGKDNIGATVKGYIDAIRLHDEIVQKYEEAFKQRDDFKQSYRRRNRLFRNLDSAWNVIMTNPVEFAEYQELKPKMRNIESRLELIDDPDIKARLTTQYNRFKEIEPKCSRQMIIYQAYTVARQDRDKATQELLSADRILMQIKESEKIQAAKISDDHILADEMKKTLTNLFPNIHVGYILCCINNENVENLAYDEVQKVLRRVKPPHKAEFKRYDYRYDPFTAEWYSLQVLRDLGVCVEDPLIQRMSFIALAAKGDLKAVQQLLKQGIDPNGTDLTGNTALVAAAVNQHIEVVQLLFQSGADINCRDKNMMTPLLYTVNRGYMEITRVLLDLGADRSCMDQNMRGCVFYAVLSGNIHLVRLFLKKERLNITDKLWGFTPLHLAANLGSIEMINFLLNAGCSLFHFDRRKRTPETVAFDSGNPVASERLKEERINAPAQLVYVSDDTLVQYWVGDVEAMEVAWCTDVEFTHIIYFLADNGDIVMPTIGKSGANKNNPYAHLPLPSQAVWLKKEKNIVFKPLTVEVLEDDGDYHDNWEGLEEHIPEIIQMVNTTVKEVEEHNNQQVLLDNDTEDGRQHFKLLICDDTGASLAPAMMSILMLLKHQPRIKDTLKEMKESRPRVEIGPEVSRGLDQMQQMMDAKVMKRYNQRLRGSMVASSAF